MSVKTKIIESGNQLIIQLTAKADCGDEVRFSRIFNNTEKPPTLEYVVKHLTETKCEGVQKVKCHTCPFNAISGKLDISDYDGPTENIFDIWRCHNNSKKQCAGAALATGITMPEK